MCGIGGKWIASDTAHRRLASKLSVSAKSPAIAGLFAVQSEGCENVRALRGGNESAGFTREAVEDRLTSRGFDEMEDRERNENQDDIREPGIQGGEVKAFGHAVGVEELKDIEM